MNVMVRKKPRRAQYVIAIIINGLMLFVFNNLLNWNVPVITPHFAEVLWAFNLSINATIVVNALYLVYDAGWFRHLTQIMLAILAFNSVYWLYAIFPFNLSYAIWGQGLRWALILAMFGNAIAVIVEVGKLISRKD